MINRRLVGTVVSDKMQKTVVVQVERKKRHAKYGKQYSLRTKFKAHSPADAFHVGDVVEISESRPLSRTKRWVVTRKLERTPR